MNKEIDEQADTTIATLGDLEALSADLDRIDRVLAELDGGSSRGPDGAS